MVKRLLLASCGLCLAMTCLAEEEEVPDIAFLEYLGMWEESDEEWLLHEEMEQATVERRRELAPLRGDPAPEGEESPEKDDES